MFEYTSDEKACSFLSWGPHTDIAEAEAFLQSVESQKDAPKSIHWGVCLNETGKLIGAMHIYDIDFAEGSAMLSYMLGSKYSGKGYMSACIKAAIEACFSSLSLDRVMCDIAQENAASARVAEKSGMSPASAVKPWRQEIKGRIMQFNKYIIERTS